MSKSKNSLPLENVVISIAAACQDAKGQDLAVYDVTKITDLAEKYIIVSGRSDRHAQGIATRILHQLEEVKIKPMGMEGFDKAHWIVLDLDNIMVHIFYEPVRNVYDLEALWHAAQKQDIETALKQHNKESAAA